MNVVTMKVQHAWIYFIVFVFCLCMIFSSFAWLFRSSRVPYMCISHIFSLSLSSLGVRLFIKSSLSLEVRVSIKFDMVG